MQSMLSLAQRRVALSCLGALLSVSMLGMLGCGAQRGVPASGSGPAPVGATLTMTRCGGAAAAPAAGSASSGMSPIYISALGADSGNATTSDLYALAPDSGVTLWCDQFALPFPFTCAMGEHCPPPPQSTLGPPLLADGALYVCASGGYTYALNASDGALRWRRQTGCMGGADPADTAPPPALADGVLYPGSDALDVATGAVRWRLPAADAEPSAVADGVLYGFDQGDVFAWNAQTGEQLWSYSLPDPIGGGGPCVANGVVYVGDIGGNDGGAQLPDQPDTFALDAHTGKLLWRAPTGVASSSPLVVGDVVYVGGFGPDMFAVDATTGRILWRDDTAPDSSPSTAVAQGGVVYFTAEGAYAVDAASGRILWRQALGASLSTGFTAPALAGGALYFAKMDGRGGATLYALSAHDGATLWTRGGFGQLSSPVVAALTL